MYTLDDFEWDPDKAAQNFAKHKVSFKKAVEAFNDPNYIEQVDDRYDYDEERINLLGRDHNGVLLHVTYTERDDFFRIISIRKANKHEQNVYACQITT